MEEIKKGRTYRVTITFIPNTDLIGRTLYEALGDALCDKIGGDYDIGEYEEEVESL